MKGIAPLFWTALLAAGMTVGCGHLDVTPQDDPHRILDGTIEFNDGTTLLPEDTIVVVTVIDSVPPPVINAESPQNQMLKPQSPPTGAPPEVLGELTIRNPGPTPVAFRLEYRADADQLKQGLNIQARVSYDGRVRYVNLDHYAIGINDYTQPHVIRVDPAR